MLAEILGGSSTSRLYRQLVVDDAVAIHADADYSDSSLGETEFGISGVPRGDTDLPGLQARVDQVIADLVKNGVTDEELRRAKVGVRAATVYAEDNPTSLARTFGEALLLGETVAEVQHWPDRITAVTVADVNAAARKYLDIRRSVTGFLVGEPE